MSTRSLLFTGLVAVVSLQAQAREATAQAPVDVEIRAAIVTEDLEVHSLPQVSFAIVSAGEIVVEFDTDLDGRYTAMLTPGLYAVESVDEVEFGGSKYSWNVSFTVDTGGTTLELTQKNANKQGGLQAAGGVPAEAGRGLKPAPGVGNRAVFERAGQVQQTLETSLPPSMEVISGWWDEVIGVYNVDFPGKVIARLSVPEGSYVIVAKLVVRVHVDGSGSPGCRLVAGGDADQAQESYARPPSEYRDPGELFVPSTITLNIVHSFSQQGNVLLQCWGRISRHGFFQVGNIKITALEVAKVTNNPLKLMP